MLSLGMLFRASKWPAAFCAFALALVVALGPTPAAAQRIPPDNQLEVLIKRSLATFNDANVTGIYDVFHASMSRPFRQQFTVERLRDAFKAFNTQLIDISPVLALKPVMSEPAQLDREGALLLKGTFETRPSRVIFSLRLLPAEGDWRLIAINVNVMPADQKGTGTSGQMQ